MIETALVGSLIAGATSIAGTVANSSAMGDANDTNRSIANQANQTQIELANTAHQREVSDLKAAGLNPILSAGGSGSSTPSLHAPTVSPVTNSLGDAMAQGITNYSALQGSKQYDPLVDKMRSEKALNDVLITKAAADTSSALANAERTKAERSRILEDIKVVKGGTGAKVLGTNLFSNANEKIADKLDQVISGVTVNSARKSVPYYHDNFNKGSFMDKVQNWYNFQRE